MKKFICTSLIMLLALSSCLSANAFCFKFWKKKPAVKEQVVKPEENQKDFEILPTMNTVSNAKNQVWVGTFQIVWNDLIDELLKNPVEFIGYKSVMAENLNKKSFSVNDISENSYYKKWGLVSPEMRTEIEQGIKDKFNETSDILGSLDWTPATKKYILYAMLKKDFEYVEQFTKLPDGHFEGSEGNIKYFGLDSDSSYKVRNSIGVSFYNNRNDFAVTLKSKQGDIVHLYRTDDDKTLEEYYADMTSKTNNFRGELNLDYRDKFKAPMIDFKSERSFDEVCNKPIKNSDIMLDKAIETIQFKMDEAGVKLKSEAVIVTKLTCFPGAMYEPRYFYFDNKYIVFLEEKGKKPYFGMKVTDAKKLQN